MGPYLLANLQGDLDDQSITRIEEGLTRAVVQTRVRGVLIDVSGLAAVDSFIARVVARVVAMVRLLGAEAVLVGVRPAMAITLVELGIPLAGVPTALDAEDGMRMLGAAGAETQAEAEDDDAASG